MNANMNQNQNMEQQNLVGDQQNLFIDMMNSSFVNIPLMQDQDVIEIKCPLPIDESNINV
jgi:hypothetical protein